MSAATVRRLHPWPASLYDQPELMARIFNAVTDAIVVFDASGRMRFGNAAAERLLGVDAAGLRGLELRDFIAYDTRAAVADQCADYFAAPSTVPFGATEPWHLLPRSGVPVVADLGLSATRVDGRVIAIAVLRARPMLHSKAA